MSTPEDASFSGFPQHGLDLYVWIWWVFVRAVWKLDLDDSVTPAEMERYLIPFTQAFEALSLDWHRLFKRWIASQVASSPYGRATDMSAASLVRDDRINLGTFDGAPDRFFRQTVSFATSQRFISSTRRQLHDCRGFVRWVRTMRLGLEHYSHNASIDRQNKSKTFDESLSLISPILVRALVEWDRQTQFLSAPLAAPASAVSTEYMEWLQAHPDAVGAIAWDAFEKVIFEVFKSYGFVVDITARVRGKSADIIALHTSAVGVSTKYLIECKRYAASRRVGLAAVNAVVGAAQRAGADHAILVTTSAFSRGVLDQKSALEQLRLHLRDGSDIKEWLRDYQAAPNQGFRITDGYDYP